ncbi:unnamed protein product [Leptosia nina]|uniref:Uncharacterized protein n=1 Tax=Leptosia nina TaxID=320188 RepID=A0AAV1J7E1_9NEOP
MNKFSSRSNFSLDSLETDLKNNPIPKITTPEENMETILVPFYEKDVLIKVPRLSKEKKRDKKNNKTKKESEPKSYLVNKNVQQNKKSSYLDLFRKQFIEHTVCKKKQTTEIRSMSPQVGDTEIGSIEDEVNQNNSSDFYNTEAYNDVYYEKLINQDMEFYLDQSLEELQFSQDLEYKSQDEMENLKSVSEVSQRREHRRRATVQPMHDMKLGGLGPDTENIRPRLERARSLQRYSEKVRMENRLRIYKKAVEEESKKNLERQASTSKPGSAKKNVNNDDHTNSYLVNKSMKEKSSVIKKIYHGKSRSASVQNQRAREKPTNNKMSAAADEQKTRKSNTARNSGSVRNMNKTDSNSNNGNDKRRSKGTDKGNNTDNDNQYTVKKVQPVEISFLVNIDTGLRPSSALRKLEEKHRLYQEKVKAFTSDYRN